MQTRKSACDCNPQPGGVKWGQVGSRVDTDMLSRLMRVSWLEILARWDCSLLLVSGVFVRLRCFCFLVFSSLRLLSSSFPPSRLFVSSSPRPPIPSPHPLSSSPLPIPSFIHLSISSTFHPIPSSTHLYIKLHKKKIPSLFCHPQASFSIGRAKSNKRRAKSNNR